MGEAAGAGADVAGESAAGSAGKGGGGLGDVASSVFGGGAGDVAPVAGADAAGAAAGASPFALESPLTAGSFDYLSGAAPLTADAGGAAPLITADASLNTATSSPFVTDQPFGAGSALPSGTANASGQPFAAGGTTGITSGTASIDPAASGGVTASAPSAGTSASSIAPAATTATGAAPADATSSWADMLKKGLTSNPLGTAIAAGGLGYNILQGQKTTANQAALGQAAQAAAGTGQQLATAGQQQVTANQGNAAPLLAQGEALTQPLSTGQLPAQYTQQIETAINDAKTTAISNAAKNGQPTDPTKNTALAQQLQQIEDQRAQMTTNIANTLFGAGSGLINTATGVGNQSAASLLSGGQNAANLSGQLYTTLTGIDSKQADQTAKAIAALAQSLNSGGSTTQKAA